MAELLVYFAPCIFKNGDPLKAERLPNNKDITFGLPKDTEVRLLNQGAVPVCF